MKITPNSAIARGVLLCLAGFVAMGAPASALVQDAAPAAAKPPATQEVPKPGEIRSDATQAEIDAALAERLRQIGTKQPAQWSAEELAERVALSYRGFNFAQLKKVYNTGREEGRIAIQTTDGELKGEYTRRYVTGKKMLLDRVRLDIIFETSPKPEDHLRYTLTYNGASVWAAQNSRYVTPDPSASAAFRASIVNDYTALFRWQDDGATLSRLGVKKLQGIEFEVLELKRPDIGSVSYYVSPKSWRILYAEYPVVLAEGQPPATFREGYSEWRVIQEVLVPTRRKLRQNDQLVQTIDLSNATYGVTHDDTAFLQQ